MDKQEDFWRSHTPSGWSGELKSLTYEQKRLLVNRLELSLDENSTIRFSKAVDRLYESLIDDLQTFKTPSALIKKYKPYDRPSSKIDTLVSKELEIIKENFTSFEELGEHAHPLTMSVIEETAEELGMEEGFLKSENLVHEILNHLNIQRNKSRHQFLTYYTVLALLGIYEDFSEKKAGRIYIYDQNKETGKFLEFVQTFFSFIPDELLKKTPLTKIVRNVLEDRKSE